MPGWPASGGRRGADPGPHGGWGRYRALRGPVRAARGAREGVLRKPSARPHCACRTRNRPMLRARQTRSHSPRTFLEAPEAEPAEPHRLLDPAEGGFGYPFSLRVDRPALRPTRPLCHLCACRARLRIRVRGRLALPSQRHIPVDAPRRIFSGIDVPISSLSPFIRCSRSSEVPWFATEGGRARATTAGTTMSGFNSG